MILNLVIWTIIRKYLIIYHNSMYLLNQMVDGNWGCENLQYQSTLLLVDLLTRMVYDHFVISSGDPYFWTFTNLSQHYIAPILFLLDWFISNDVSYDDSFLKTWLIYPSLYLVFALTNGVLGLSSNTGSSYIYGFLNFEEFGFVAVLTVVVAVYVLLIILSVLSIFLSKKLNKNIN